MKRCPKCTMLKPLAQFDSQRVYCKPCKAAISAAWRKANPAASVAAQRRYSSRHCRDWSAATAEKSRQLGQPYGTAMHNLRKRIMFALVQRLGEDVCFKCGQKILTAGELSIEHKVDWLHSPNPVDVFGDLGNIAFSHRICNKKRTRH